MREGTLTLLLVNLADIMERADESLLPAVYKEVGADLHIDPTGLGLLTQFRSIVQIFCYPLAAYLAIRHNRAHVIALGAFLWAFATFLVAISSTFLQVAVSRALNGIGLAIVIPALKSLVADCTDETNRGTAFGWLQLTGNLGAILGNICAILLGSKTFIGIPGWRIAFHLVAIGSVIIGILVRFFASDPRFTDSSTNSKDEKPHLSFWTELQEMLEGIKLIVRVPTFQVLVAQGVSGGFPWSALSFAPMWLELIGFSHKVTAILMTIFVIGCSLGGLFGGKMGDVLAKHLPNSGRIILSQISSGSFIPLAAILLLGLPYDPSSAFLHCLLLFIMGLCISWNGPATNNPIFAEIVPEKHRTSMYAIDRSLNSVLSSFAPTIVGILAQRVYGYKPVVEGSSNTTAITTNRENAASLAKALYSAIGIPISICCFIYTFLYCTYPRDRERAKMQVLIESEIQLMTSDTSVAQEVFPLQFSDYEYPQIDERSVINIEHESSEDENDEKALLSSEVLLSNSGKPR